MKNPRAASLAMLVCLIPLLGWWLYGLFDLDEGFYATVVAEMNRRGEWITPFFNGQPWFEKPVLLYWVAKPCLMLFGGEFGIRLPSILASLTTYGLLFWFGKRRFGLPSGLIAALVLSTSLFFVAVGRMVLVDPILITCLTGALLTFWESLVGDRRWRLVCAALLGAAVLAKGPVAVVVFVAVAGYTFWRERDLRPAYRDGWLTGALIFFGVVTCWYLPAYLANGQVFVQKFLIEQNWQRFRGGDEAHAVAMPLGLIYYVPVVLVGMAPWSLFALRSWPRRGEPGEDASLRRYLATWAVVVFAFFTVSGTKLPHYVLPCFPPLALLVGHDLATRWRSLTTPRIVAFAGGAVALGVFLTFGFRAYYEAAATGPKLVASCLMSLNDGRSRTPRAEVAMFRLGKQPDGLYPAISKPMLLGRWPIGINDTSTPSLLFYLDPMFRGRYRFSDIGDRPPELNGVALDTDDLIQVMSAPKPEYVVTRPGRLSESDRARLAVAGYEARDLRIGDPLLTAYIVDVKKIGGRRPTAHR